MKDLFSQLLGMLPEYGLLGGLPCSRSHRLPKAACIQWLESKCLILLSQLRRADSSGAPGALCWGIALQLNFSLCSFLLLSLLFHRCQSQEHSLDILHTNLHLRVCFPGNPNCNNEGGMLKNVWKPGIHMLSTLWYLFNRLLSHMPLIFINIICVLEKKAVHSVW